MPIAIMLLLSTEAIFSQGMILDTSFGTGGKVLTDLNLNARGMLDALVLPDGKIVGGAFTPQTGPLYPYTGGWVTLVKYNANGTIDTTFGNNGITFAQAGTFSSNTTLSMLLQSDNKIVVCGRNDNEKLFLARFSPNGSIDNTFGTNGISFTTIPLTSQCSSILQADGKILVTTQPIENSNAESDFTVSRFNTNGVITDNFGQQNQYSANWINNLKEDDGKILLIGNKYSPYGVLAMARYVDGTLSTNSPGNKSKFTVYPNPFAETVQVDFNLTETQTITLELFDIHGRKLVTLLPSATFATGNNSRQIPLPQDLSSGTYFLKISSATFSDTIKIMKQ
ncbi:MAG TPA: T9SS type A sorting domain-containing protein [Flavobacterium sp.]|nr:T9SS type A sorting domain-containing protein [Flavobacterium sp.]